MRMFYRSAPVLMVLSVALAGCSESDPPAAKSTGDAVKPSAGATASATSSAADTEVCLTIDGMH